MQKIFLTMSPLGLSIVMLATSISAQAMYKKAVDQTTKKHFQELITIAGSVGPQRIKLLMEECTEEEVPWSENMRSCVEKTVSIDFSTQKTLSSTILPEKTISSFEETLKEFSDNYK